MTNEAFFRYILHNGHEIEKVKENHLICPLCKGTSGLFLYWIRQQPKEEQNLPYHDDIYE